jgi:triacylglycerol lipase
MIKMVSPKWPWMAARAAEVAASPENSTTRLPVVLVHGIFDSENAMRSWKRLLRKRGYETFSITFQPATGHASIGELAAQLDAFVRENIAEEQRFHLVGHSMGGLVMRCYAQRFDSARRVCGFVTLGSPHRGSWWAKTLPRPGCVDMRAGSTLLKDLEAGDAKLAALQPLSIWTPFDLMILPSTSSIWPAAKNERCWLPSHPNLKHSRWLTARVVRFLKEREEAEAVS